MATPFNEVYDFFLTEVKDYSFIKLNQQGLLEDALFKHLRSAIVEFMNCNQDLSFDTQKREFSSDLTLLEMKILANWMIVSYVSGKSLNVSNLEPIMSDKEYVKYSQSNHLDKIIKLKDKYTADASHLMSIYSYNDGLEGVE